MAPMKSERNYRHFQFLWKSIFSDPSQQLDYRSGKVCFQFPDFKHNVTGTPLWLVSFNNLHWVAQKFRCKGLATSTRAQIGEVCTSSENVHWVARKLRCKGLATSSQAQIEELCTSSEIRLSPIGMPAGFVAKLRHCTKYKILSEGTRMHDEILKRGLLGKCADALITMYAKCGELAKAKELLDTHKSRDMYAWTALIAGYNLQGQSHDALRCFEQLQKEGLSPDCVVFGCALKACGSLRRLDKGEKIHDEIDRQGLLNYSPMLCANLVAMYAKCGAFTKAHELVEGPFVRYVLCWFALIKEYAQEGQSKQVLNCFAKMGQKGFPPTVDIYTYVLNACGNLGEAHVGEQIHDEISRRKVSRVLGTALVDMYAKCGNLTKAQQVLEKLTLQDVAAWNTLLIGYTQQHQAEEALTCFEQMQREGISPNVVTFSCILKACGSIGALKKGEEIYEKIASQGLLENNVVLGNSVVVMYAKCRAFTRAQEVLEELPCRDVSSWNALLTLFLQQGQCEQILKCFKLMQVEGISPNALTFSCVLNACSHLGLVDYGRSCFENMCSKYGLKPGMEHYTCMIDLFGRAGHLDRAVEITQQIPYNKDSAVWCALLGACRKQIDVDVGRWAFQQAVNVSKSVPSPYVLMAEIYAAAGMQEEAKRVEALSVKNKAWKVPGCSWWVDKSGVAHMFHVGDTKHVQINAIHAKLEDLSYRLSKEGYSPCLYWVSSNNSYDSRMDSLCDHSGKLALACALINTPQSESIRIVNNMLLCGDCHMATALISRIEKRQILIRDANRCHDFKDGKCSCGDYA